MCVGEHSKALVFHNSFYSSKGEGAKDLEVNEVL